MNGLYHNGLTPYLIPRLEPHLLPQHYRRRSFPSFCDRRARDHRYDRYERSEDDRYERRHGHRRPRRDGSAKDVVLDLDNETLKGGGDLGWTLEYAAAYCYKNLIGNRPGIINTINSVRKAPLERRTAFLIFDCLDQSLFAHKLKGMVYLKWSALVEDSPGVTSAPGVVSHRITIELNTTPFLDEKGDIDDLLDMLIHQMIHAFFLVCCGDQEKGTKQDGRLLDGLHFGIVVYSINDITKACRRDSLCMEFHASSRLRRCGSNGRPPWVRQREFISIDPHGSAIAPPPADSRSHCTLDNRQFNCPQLRNWQVQEFARCVDLGMEAKGDIVYNLNSDGKLEDTTRLKGPPSCTYVELVWDDKRVMANREKAMAFSSLKKPLAKEGKHELKVPKCDFLVFKCLYDFLQHSKYLTDREGMMEAEQPATHRRRRGPPIITGHTGYADPATSIINHVCVFKMAEAIRFEELQKYALSRLYNTRATSDDPILALQEIYNDKDSNSPIHAELHKWARKFLVRTDDGHDDYIPSEYRRSSCRGTSNYEKLLCHDYRERFIELYHRNMALKDDCKLVAAELMCPGALDDTTVLNLDDSSYESLGRTIDPLSYSRTSLLDTRRSILDTRRRITYDPLIRSRSPLLTDRLNRLRITESISPALDFELGLGRVREEVSSPPCYYERVLGRRRRRENSLTGERFGRESRRWRDERCA